MAQCYNRKVAWLTDNGLKFGFNRPACKCSLVTIPCGKCLACRVNNAASWATRCLHESQYVDTSCFLTLTYRPERVPIGYNLCKRDLQLFFKRLRYYHSFRSYFACGEYGTKRGRPHYHAIIFGWCPDDLEYFGQSYSGMDIFVSRFIDDIWDNGFVKIGTLSSGSASYVARYQKKNLSSNYGNREPPFFLASRDIILSNGSRGSLGAQWLLDNFKSLRLGYVHHPDHPDIKCRIPDYYFRLLQRFHPDFYEDVKLWRYQYAIDINNCISPIDNHGQISVLYQGNDLRHCLVRFLHLDNVRDFSDDDLLLRAREAYTKLKLIQDARLGALKRNYE